MKKNLRMLFLGLAAAAFGTGFAQENVTGKLLNADMSRGVLGWDITFTNEIWTKQTKNQEGYHGFKDACLQVWKGNYETGLTDNSISQTLTGLPNGTYVFGAYIAAAKNDSIARENREEIVGITLFANEVSVPVATNWPERPAYKWSHSAKFNVAAQVTDGTLTVGIKAEETNANFIIFDNATLYYFNEGVDAGTALNEVTKLDLANSVALADTCKAHKMNVDTLTALNTAVEAAQAVTGVEGAYEADENLWWAFRQARKSINDYRRFDNAIKAADEVLAQEWSEYVADAIAELETMVGEAKTSYTAATMNRAELNDYMAVLNEAVAFVELDGAYLNMENAEAWVNETEPSDELGGYSQYMRDRVDELCQAMYAVTSSCENGEISAITALHRCDSLFALIQNIWDNPIVYDQFPIHLHRSESLLTGKSYKVLEGATVNEEDDIVYTSKTYRFEEPLTKVRFLVKETGNNSKCGDFVFFTLSSFKMFDGEGNEIELDEDMVYSNADHNRLNPNALDGQGLPGLLDDDPTTFFHSTWKTVLDDHHYLEVTLPPGEYSAFSFSMTARHTVPGSYEYAHQFPAEMEIMYKSDKYTELQNAVVEARGFKPYRGTSIGFYNADVEPYYTALAEAEALLADENPSDAVVAATLDKLAEERAKIEAVGVTMPEPGKKYRIISAGPFFAKQNVHKALTVHSDVDDKTNWIWWETASPDSAQQLFSFEYIENEENLPYYAVKHEATGLYIGQLFQEDEDGEVTVVSNTAGLNAEKDTVELRSLGLGQFGLFNDGQFHTGDHNNGTIGTGSAVYGCEHAVLGDKSGICKWATGANSGSAWYIRELETLPFNAKSVSDLNFRSKDISLYTGVNTLTLTADTDCAFADLVVYGTLGEVIPSAVTADGAVATVVLDTTLVENFSFSFTNAEGVAAVTVDGVISKLSVLQEAYNAAKAVAPVKGEQLGQYSDLAEYEAALKAAEDILAGGGTDEAVLKAAADLDSAVVHLMPNLPLADKNYFILCDLPAFKTNHGVDMAFYANTDAPAWSYVNIRKNEYLWKFVDCGELKYGDPAFYIQNVATGTYLSQYPGSMSQQITFVTSTDATQPYRIDFVRDTAMLVSDCRYTNKYIHPNGHGNGANAKGNLVHWDSGAGTASALRIVEAEMYIEEYLQEVGIEDVEISGEYVAPAKKGIYDLFGRRIEAPAATGIYIVDGKKRVIKK